MQWLNWMNTKTSTVNFSIKKPTKGRASFAIFKKTFYKGEKPKYETIADPRLAAINKAFQSKLKPTELAYLEVKEILKELYAKRDQASGKAVFNDANHKLLNHYFDSVYSNRDVDMPAALNRLKRAVAGVGSLSLYSASREQLQKAVDQYFSHNANVQRDMVATINQLLKFIGRPLTDRLRKHRYVFSDVRYLNPKEFTQVLTHIDDKAFKLLCIVSFATGVRVGEAFAIRESDIHGRIIKINGQIDRNGKRRATKNRRSRNTVVSDALFMPFIYQFLELPEAELIRLRKMSHSKVFKKICEKAFEGKKNKICVFHDLRHSYAVNAVALGISLANIANAIGDTIAVTEQYYSGFSLTTEAAETMLRGFDK